MTTHTDLLAAIDALAATVALHPGMVEAPNGERWRGALEVLRELAQLVDTNIMMTEMISVDVARLTARLAALEAGQRETRGDGK